MVRPSLCPPCKQFMCTIQNASAQELTISHVIIRVGVYMYVYNIGVDDFCTTREYDVGFSSSQIHAYIYPVGVVFIFSIQIFTFHTASLLLSSFFFFLG